MPEEQAQADPVGWVIQTIESQRGAWAKCLTELADKLREGRFEDVRPLAVKLKGEEDTEDDEGMGRCQCLIESHRKESERIPEDLRRVLATTVERLWELPVWATHQIEFDWVPAEQWFRSAARIFSGRDSDDLPTIRTDVPEEFLETVALAVTRTGESEGVIRELSKKRRGRPHPLKQIDRKGLLGAARHDSRECDRMLGDRKERDR